MSFSRSKRVNGKIPVHMQISSLSTATVTLLHEKEDEESVYLPVFHISCYFFNFLHEVTFFTCSPP